MEPTGLIEQMMNEAMKHPALASIGVKPQVTEDRKFLIMEMTASQLREVVSKSNPKMAGMELELHEGKALIKFKL